MLFVQVAAVALAGWSGHADGAWESRQAPPARVIQLPRMPMREAVEHVRMHTGLVIQPLWIDEEHDGGLDHDAQVGPVEMRGDPEMMLEAFLHAAGGEPGDEPTWQFGADGAVQIGPRSRLDDFVLVKVYDVQDLLSVLPDYRDAPELDVNAALERTGSLFSGEDENIPLREGKVEASTDALIGLILNTVEPQVWIDMGGRAGTIMLYQERLVVRAPGYVHRALGGD